MSAALVHAGSEVESEEDAAFFQAFLDRQSPTALAAFIRSCEEAEAEADRTGWLTHEQVFGALTARYADIDDDG